MSINEPKRDPRIIRTRQLLKTALVELIHENGYEKIKVTDITERAMLNRATFYLHYRDKFDLLRQSSEETLDGLIASLDSDLKEGEEELAYDQPHRTFIQMFEHISLNSQLFKVFLTEKNMSHFTSQMMEVIVDFVSEGMSRKQPDDEKLTVPREIAVRYISSAFLGVITWWLEKDMPYTPKYMAKLLMKLGIQGPYIENPFLK